MSEQQIEAGLQSLENSLKQMKALVAWEELKRAEARPHQPPAFQIYDPTETDLRNEYSYFLSTSIKIHTILREHGASLSDKTRESIARQMVKIEQEVHGLNLHQRFWKC